MGHEGVVRLLLQRPDIDLEVVAAGKTAIELAAAQGHGKVVELLQG